MSDSPRTNYQQTATQIIAEIASNQLTSNLQAQSTIMAGLAQQLLSSQHTSMANIASQALEALKPVVFKVDFDTSIIPGINKIVQNAVGDLTPLVESIQHLQRQQFGDLFEGVGKFIRLSFPPNWQGDNLLIPNQADLEELLLDEGLALAYVPPKKILEQIFKSPDAQTRRNIIGRNWRKITQCCEIELTTIQNPKLVHYAGFANSAASSLLDSHTAPSQALSISTLDSALRLEFNPSSFTLITNQSTRFDINGYSLRIALVLGGIWGSYGQYWPNAGDKIPRRLSRHATAHGVSNNQYSRVNAVIALMHLTALLLVMDRDLKHIS
jgi:hypothetical protein